MSRIGRKIIKVPEKVKVQIQQNSLLVEGPKGKLKRAIHPRITISQEAGILKLARAGDERLDRSLHGLTRALVSNMIKGVSEGFVENLEINGVGYRAAVKGNTINFTLGFSHQIDFALPDGVKAKVDANTKLTLESTDREALGEVAARIRQLRPPEPYQGKGIKYADEFIRRKVGKSAAK